MEPQKPFPQRAATASWVAGLAAWYFSSALRPDRTKMPFDEFRMQMIAIGVCVLLIMVIGVVLGCMALAGVKKHGRSGIVLPAVAGLVINGVGIGLFGFGLLSAWWRS